MATATATSSVLKRTVFVLISFLIVLMAKGSKSAAMIPKKSVDMRRIERRKEEEGASLGLVVPNAFEMNPLLQSSNFVQDNKLPFFDFGGRRFRFGKIQGEKVVIVMSGLGMLNAGLTTQLLLTLFRVKGVIHFGIAGNANSDLQIGDVTVPRYWAHLGLWNWQRYGDGPDDKLAFESGGDYTRTIGYLNFSNYTVGGNSSTANSLNRVWYQPEEIFPVKGIPEVRQHAFWIPVNKKYYALSQKLETMKLERCANSTTCLDRRPIVVRVKRGCSANIFVDNADYRQFLSSKFNVTPVDMETAGVALVCLQHDAPFVAIRSLSDLAGGGSSQSNEASIFSGLAAQNAVTVVTEFISLLA